MFDCILQRRSNTWCSTDKSHTAVSYTGKTAVMLPLPDRRGVYNEFVKTIFNNLKENIVTSSFFLKLILEFLNSLSLHLIEIRVKAEFSSCSILFTA